MDKSGISYGITTVIPAENSFTVPMMMLWKHQCMVWDNTSLKHGPVISIIIATETYSTWEA